MDHRERFQPLNDAIVGSSAELARLFHDKWAQWYSLALSDLALLIDGTDVQLADARVSRSGPGVYSVRIVVFTDRLVIIVDAEVTADDVHHTTRARSRADLRAVTVAAEVGAFGDDWGGPAWPGVVRVTLDYGEAEQLVLPGAEHPDRPQHERVVNMLPSLRADLTA